MTKGPNKRRLRVLIKVLKRVKKSDFDMYSWAKPKFDRRRGEACGTIACAGGHFALSP